MLFHITFIGYSIISCECYMTSIEKLVSSELLNSLQIIIHDKLIDSPELSKVCIPLCCVIFNSLRHPSGISESLIRFSSMVKAMSQFWPCLHIMLILNSEGVIPLDGISAGFSLPEQWYTSIRWAPTFLFHLLGSGQMASTPFPVLLSSVKLPWSQWNKPLSQAAYHPWEQYTHWLSTWLGAMLTVVPTWELFALQLGKPLVWQPQILLNCPQLIQL